LNKKIVMECEQCGSKFFVKHVKYEMYCPKCKTRTRFKLREMRKLNDEVIWLQCKECLSRGRVTDGRIPYRCPICGSKNGFMITDSLGFTEGEKYLPTFLEKTSGFVKDRIWSIYSFLKNKH